MENTSTSTNTITNTNTTVSPIQPASQYTMFDHNELLSSLDSLTETNADVVNFFEQFSFDKIINQNMSKSNTTNLFKNVLKDDPTKAKIIGFLNKLKQENLLKTVSGLREIAFQSQEELDDFVFQCVQKIKKENESNRPIVAMLCKELLDFYFISESNDKIYFRKLLLTCVKKEYQHAINFDADTWTSSKAEKVMILIGTLHNNGQIIDNNIINGIIEDLKKNIVYEENKSYESNDKTEKSIHLMSYLVSTIIPNETSMDMFLGLKTFLIEQLSIYEQTKTISKKIRLVCNNVITHLTENCIEN